MAQVIMSTTPVLSSTEESGKDARRRDNSGGQERTRPGTIYVLCM